jgi:hypothetical protein
MREIARDVSGEIAGASGAGDVIFFVVPSGY